MPTLKERATQYQGEHANVMNLARENKYDEARSAQSALLKKAGLQSQAEVEESGLGGVDVDASTWMPQAPPAPTSAAPPAEATPPPIAAEPKPSMPEAPAQLPPPIQEMPEPTPPTATPLSLTGLGGGVPQSPAVQGLASSGMGPAPMAEEASPANAQPPVSGTVQLRQLSKRTFPESSMALAGLRKVY